MTTGLRERKRLATRERIAETGLRLFIAHGFEAVTLDAIAAAADISRRTFFHYFDSKEEIVFAWQTDAWELLRREVLSESTKQRPIDAVRNAISRSISRFPLKDLAAIERLMRSSPSLQARKQASFAAQEKALYDVLCEMWPQKERRHRLRLTAMAAIGALRVALDSWAEHGCKTSPDKYVREAFEALKAEV